MTDQHGMTPSLRLAHVDGMLDYGREHGTIPFATFESARNHLAAVVNEHNALLAEVEQSQAERDGDTMDPTDVPDELAAVLKPLTQPDEQPQDERDGDVPDDLYWSFTGGMDTCYGEHDGEYRECCWRAGLAYVLKLHEQQLRAQGTEYGIRADFIDTTSAEFTVAETLDEALEALARFDEEYGGKVVSRELVQRLVGEWRKVGDVR